MSNEDKLRRALARKTFSIVEPYLSGWRVIVGFNDLREAQDAHCRIEALAATQEQRGAPGLIESHHAEEWQRCIVNAGGDIALAQQAVALAALNGLFDLHRALSSSKRDAL